MIFVAFVSDGVIGFVTHELSELLTHLKEHQCHRIEIWKGSERRGGYYC
jgi:Leu/Phe-tRNA-protein transferase